MTYSLLKTCCTPATSHYAGSPQFLGGKFRNPVRPQRMGLGKTLAVLWRFLFDKPADASPAQPIPVLSLSRAELLTAPEGSLYRLGHSTMLLKLEGEFWLTDPVFAERASPLSFLGPKRFHAPPISLDDLPPIKAVILSHDHYDHLDRVAVLALAAKTDLFLTPLGVGDTLISWGIPAAQVRQLDWWQEVRVGALRLVATPAQHFSGRGLRDGNRNLWASWVMLGERQRVFFSGDSGYFAGFKTIGERFGPFDLTLIETGAYNKDWADVHMQPEQSLQAHLDLRGRHLMPVHNGTFDLALHPWQEPFERIFALAAAQGVALTTPRMGERIAIGAPPPAQAWWRD
ncbi:MBL fold metallo-hydrolase [Paucibacter sp. PLA-PC-4]|uniref:MBL fold metallo-hydrolase n=1 Tax=Paucibacter sp. PLA-PC-4 TaxID=2993655 RepID=UPI002248ACE4|nr:MBL fold metallo-hydrolase [Paucibacter sp. PLA-PC-4]MCX2861495.1 MBL fold metallo-hydrolase [Paucibacter sp. PLA-PC-4]